MLLVNTNAMHVPVHMTLSLDWLVPAGIALVGGYLLWAVITFLSRDPFDPLPIIGHWHIFGLRSRAGYMQWFLDRSKYVGAGKTWEYELPGFGYELFTTDPACIKHVLVTKSKVFSKSRVYAEVSKDFFGTGYGIPPSSTDPAETRIMAPHILLATGEHWHAQRNAVKAFVSPAALADIADRILPRNLQRCYGIFDAAAEEGRVVDFEKVVADLMLSTFGEAAFGVDPEELIAVVAEPFDRALEGISRRFVDPLWRFNAKLTPNGWKVARAIATVKSYFREMVSRSLAQITLEDMEGTAVAPSRAGYSYIRALLDSKEKISKEDIADSCRTALVAGRDTTSDSITWTLYALLRHPHYLRRAISEFDSLSSLPTTVPNSDLLSHLPFFHTVISESLRLYPSVPLNLVDCSSSEPVVLPDGNIVEPDEDVLFSPWVMARLPEFWGPDAEEFRPERWEDMERKPSAYELPVFHAGPRSCLGQNLAKMEMAVTFKEMLTRYTFEMGWDGKERVMGEGITNPMLGGLPVRVRRRAKA